MGQEVAAAAQSGVTSPADEVAVAAVQGRQGDLATPAAGAAVSRKVEAMPAATARLEPGTALEAAAESAVKALAPGAAPALEGDSLERDKSCRAVPPSPAGASQWRHPAGSSTRPSSAAGLHHRRDSPGGSHKKAAHQVDRAERVPRAEPECRRGQGRSSDRERKRKLSGSPSPSRGRSRQVKECCNSREQQRSQSRSRSRSRRRYDDRHYSGSDGRRKDTSAREDRYRRH